MSTLLEFTIASAISISVISTGIFAFTSSHRSYKIQSQQRQILENGHYALEVLRRDVRMAGYLGLNVRPTKIIDSIDSVSTHPCIPGGWAREILHPVFLHKSIKEIAPGCVNHDDYRLGTDILRINHASSQSIDPGILETDKAYLHSSLTSGVLFIATGEIGRDLSIMQNVAELPVETYQFQSIIYFIRNCSDPKATGNRERCDDSDDRIPTLVRKTVSGNKMYTEPVAEYIDNLKIRIGIDKSTPTDFSVDQYLDSVDVPEQGRVLSVELSLQVRSGEKSEYANSSQTFVETVLIRNTKLRSSQGALKI